MPLETSSSKYVTGNNSLLIFNPRNIEYSTISMIYTYVYIAQLLSIVLGFTYPLQSFLKPQEKSSLVIVTH